MIAGISDNHRASSVHQIPSGPPVSPFRLWSGFWIWLGLLALPALSRAEDGHLDRLTLPRLRETQRAVRELTDRREMVQAFLPWRQVRANLHVHSLLSHDSRGTVEEIVSAGKKVGTEVILFTEHPSQEKDFFTDGHRGLRDGVLLIPGAETEGFLCYPTQSLKGVKPGSPQDFADLVCGRDGLMFVSHPEERMDWKLTGITGIEIYNTHADFKDEAGLLKKLRNPLWLLQSAELFQKYPQEAMSALLDYPKAYLAKYDALCLTHPHTGVAANDAHQNVGLAIRRLDETRVGVTDALGKELLTLEIPGNPILEALVRDKQAGEEVFALRLDGYEHSLRHVGTHLLLAPGSELTQEAVWDALQAGRCYVAFDWLADAAGFEFVVVSEKRTLPMGSQVPYRSEMTLKAQAPLSVSWRLFSRGKLVHQSEGRKFSYNPTADGPHRIEAWLNIAGELLPWILSNPIYLESDSSK